MNVNNRLRTAIIGGAALLIGAALGVGGMALRNHLRIARQMEDSGTKPAVSSLFSGPNIHDPGQWDPFQEIQNMQAQMDQEFNQMFQQFRTQPQFKGFQIIPNYSLSLNMQNMKDRYVVRAYLPDAKASDVHVTLDKGQTLRVEINHKQNQSSTQKNAPSQVTEWGQYEQVIQLPTPVKADQMKVNHEGHELIITIPKAG